MARNANLARTVLALFFMLFLEAGLSQAATTTFYVDANYGGSPRNGNPSNPWQSLSDNGAWSAINSSLGSGPVTVYFSARQPGSDTPETSNVAISEGRSDTSSNLLTLDGISQYNTNTSSPSWATNFTPAPCQMTTTSTPCGWYSHSRFTIKAAYPFSSNGSANNCHGYETVQGFTFQATDGQSFNGTYIGNLTVQYNEITRVATGSVGPGMYIGPANSGPCTSGNTDNVTAQYNYVHATWGECIYVGATTPDPPGGPGNSEYNSEHLTCGTSCPTGANYLIQQNLIESCASWGGQGDGTDVKDGHVNLRVLNNTYRTSKPCSNCGTQTPGNDGQGPLFESGAVVDGNYIESPGHQCMAVYSSWNNSAGRGDMLIRNNMCVNINSGIGSNTAIQLWGPNTPGMPVWGSLEVFNNTIYGAGLNSGDACIQIDSQSGGSGRFVGATVMNNIIDSCGSNGLNASSGTLVAHDFNIYNNTGGSAISYGGSFSCSGVTGSEPNSQCADPKFVSTARPYVDINFGLQSGSPAAGAGTALSPAFVDYLGNTRSVPWDLGAIAQNTVGGAPQPPTALSATVE